MAACIGHLEILECSNGSCDGRDPMWPWENLEAAFCTLDGV